MILNVIKESEEENKLNNLTFDDGLPSNSTIYCETQAVADLLSGKYDSTKTTVVVDSTLFE